MSNPIKYVEGDLFEYIDDGFDGVTYIPHIVNTHGLWASGFVVPVQKYCPDARVRYLESFDFRGNCPIPDDDLLGYNQFVFKENNEVCITNMFAQTFGVERPIRYDKLTHCMVDLAEFIFDVNSIDDFAAGLSEDSCHREKRLSRVRIVAPKFGSLRAGGNWEFIEKLIEDCWTGRGLNVTIVTYDEQQQMSKSRRKRIDVQKRQNDRGDAGLGCDNCWVKGVDLMFFDGDNKFYCRSCYNSANRSSV